MLKLIDRFCSSASAPEPSEALINPHVAAIAQTLLLLGGSGHRDEVMQQIAMDEGLSAASHQMKAELIKAFEDHCESAQAEGLRPLVHLPFGPQSLRWSLTMDAYQFLRGAAALHVALH